MDHYLHLHRFLANSSLTMNHLGFGAHWTLKSNHTIDEIVFWSFYLICQVCWPWIVSRWLLQVVQKLQFKHFDHCPIYLVILQMVSRCPISNLCLELYIYNFFSPHVVQIQIWWCSTRVSWIWISWHDANEEFLF